MEVQICVPKRAKFNRIEDRYPDVCLDYEEDGQMTYFIGKSSDNEQEDGETKWMTHDEAVECCGFVEGVCPSASCMIEGNGGWAQGMISRTDFSGLLISESAKAEYERVSKLYWAAHKEGRKARRKPRD